MFIVIIIIILNQHALAIIFIAIVAASCLLPRTATCHDQQNVTVVGGVVGGIVDVASLFWQRNIIIYRIFIDMSALCRRVVQDARYIDVHIRIALTAIPHAWHANE